MQIRTMAYRFRLLGFALLIVGAAAACAADRAPEKASEKAPDKAQAQGEPIPAMIKTLEARMAAAAKAAGAQTSELPELAAAALKLEKARLLLSDYAEGDYRDGVVRSELKEGTDMLDAYLRTHKPVLAGRRGLVEYAYLAPNDGSPQPYLVYVPRKYDGSRPFGLVVFLHGYAYDLNKYNWIQMMCPIEEFKRWADSADVICMMPFARGNTDFQAAGEDDVMLTMRKVMQTYHIDPDRVIMAGISMGGMGAWTLAAHYPHLFAAVLAVSARGDYYLWHGFGPETLPAWKQKQIGMDFGFSLLPNLQMPSVIVCGTADLLVNPEQSRLMARSLKREGYPSRLVEIENADHYSWDELLLNDALLETIGKARRNPLPRKVRYRTYTLKFNTAWWVSIRGIDNWVAPAEVTAEAGPDGSVTVTSQNVTALQLTLAEDLVGHRERVSVTWNGRTSEYPAAAFPLRIALGEPPEASDAALSKTPELCGPIREAYSGPFVIVYHPTPGGSLPDLARSTALGWYRYAQGMPKLVKDTDVTDDVLQTHNLILVGTPETNQCLARLAAKLPVRFEKRGKAGAEALHYVIGDEAWPAEGHGLQMLYPNPLHPSRYVLVISGIPWGPAIARNHIFDMLPDFIVFGADKAADGTDSQEAVFAGYFNSSWRLDPRSTWRRPPDDQDPAK